MMRIRKKDTVCVVSGKDKGKFGEIISISPKNSAVMVKDVAIVTRHVKQRKQGDVAGIRREESFLNLCKVMLVCPSCKKPCRVGSRILENGNRSRYCKACNEII